jgi:hypothetical protein
LLQWLRNWTGQCHEPGVRIRESFKCRKTQLNG